MIKTNSKKAIEAIRETIGRNVATFFGDDLDRKPTAWDAMQRFTREKFHEIARQGERAAFEDWLAGSSFAEIYTDDICATVKGWLDETDEEAARYDDEETIKLYRNLLYREFPRMAQEQKPQQGYCIELHPWVSGKTRRVLATMDLYRDGQLLASAAGLDPYPAFRTQDWIEDAVKRTGDLPLYLSDAALDPDDPSHDAPDIAVDATLRAAFQRADRIAEFATYAAPALDELALLAKRLLVDGTIGDEDYYPAVDRIYGQIAAYEAEGRFPNLLVSEIDMAHQRLWDRIMPDSDDLTDRLLPMAAGNRYDNGSMTALSTPEGRATAIGNNPCYSSASWQTDTRVYYPVLGNYLENDLCDWMGEFASDFDTEGYESEYLDLVQEILDRYGIHYIGCGIFHCDYYREEPLPNQDELIEALDEIDVVSLAHDYDRGGPSCPAQDADGLISTFEDAAARQAASRHAADAPVIRPSRPAH